MSALLDRWARSVFDGLVAAGVDSVVASPGSRSTPWLLEACRRPELDLVDIVDERSAGFFALGQARSSGRPSLLLCTSGTAPAHYLPAVIEAAESNLPLIVLSADRPLDRLDCGAPQVTDQTRLYGDHVRHFVELGEPLDEPRALRAVCAQAVRTASSSLWPTPGPVHLNARARKPLESAQPGETRLEDRAADGTGRRSRRAPRAMPPVSSVSPQALDELARLVDQAKRPLMVAGPAPLSRAAARGAVYQLARAAGLPLLADITSQLRFAGPRVQPHPSSGVLLDAGSVLLESAGFRADFRPDLILQLGAAPVSAGWERWLVDVAAADDGFSDCVHAVISEHAWHDPVRTVDLFVFAEVGELCRVLATELEESGIGERLRQRSAAWLDALVEANLEARKVARSIAEILPSEPLSEAAVARAVVAAMPAGSLLAVGNSLPIRWLDLFAPSPDAKVVEGPDLAVWCQRGVNGIDGLVSGAAGSTHALLRSARQGSAGRRPAASVLLLGDLALHHDLNGLSTLAHLPPDYPFVVVVVNNGGGRIFEQLPVARLGLDSATLAHWTTPHDRSYGGVAETFGLEYFVASDRDAFEDSLGSALERGGPSLIEARVTRDGAVRELSELRSRIDAALSTRSLASAGVER